MKLRENLKNLPPYAAGKKFPGVLKLSSNENPLGPSPKAQEVLAAEIKGVSVYPEGTSLALREALARRDGLKPEQYLVGNGSDEVLTLITGAFLNPGDRALTAAHTFSEYNFAVRLYGGETDTFGLDGAGALDLVAAAKALKPEHRMVFLCNPNNPTGGAFSQESLVTFMEAVGPGVLVVLDEAYREYADRHDYPDCFSLLARFPNLAVTRTFSKIYGLAALRVGYVIASPEMIRDISVVKQPFNVGSLAQAGALGALGDQEFLELSLDTNRRGRDFWYKALEDLGLEYYKTQGNFIALKPGLPAQEVFVRMRDAGVTIRPLDSFGLPQWIRITIGTEAQNRQCLEALVRAIGRPLS